MTVTSALGLGGAARRDAGAHLRRIAGLNRTVVRDHAAGVSEPVEVAEGF